MGDPHRRPACWHRVLTVTVVGIAMVKDEADIVGATVAHMCGQVDGVIVADNLSTDGTRDILDGLPVDVVDDPDPAYYQSEKMTRLARRAMAEGADWVVPFDADEWWYSPYGRIADVLGALDHCWAIAAADLYDHVATGADPADGTIPDRIGWRRIDKGALPKVAARATTDLSIHQGNHGVAFDAPAPTIADLLEVRHFPYRSPEQFVRKAMNGAAAYGATDLPEDVGRHWREYGRIAVEHGPEELEAVFRRWFWVYDPTSDATLVYDPAP